jgi:hypothetical protein
MGVPRMIIVNPDKAKAIWKDKWREARKPLLASLDIEFMKAVETADARSRQRSPPRNKNFGMLLNTEIVRQHARRD